MRQREQKHRAKSKNSDAQKTAQEQIPKQESRRWIVVAVTALSFIIAILLAVLRWRRDEGDGTTPAVPFSSWTPAPHHHRFSDAGCSIHRWTTDAPLSPAGIASLMDRNEPVILPLSNNWPNAAANWSKENLLRLARLDNGGGNVKVGDRKSIVSEQGYASAQGTTLLEYLDLISSEAPPEIALFDQSTFCTMHGTLCRSHGIPEVWQEVLSVNQSIRTFVSIGPENSGVGTHDHSDALFALLHGEKWFVCLPPFSIPTAELQAQYPGCLLRAGEMIFIPEGWSHATANIGDAVGVSLQSFNYRSSAHQVRSKISTAKHTGSIWDYVAHLQEAVDLFPDVWEFKIDLAKAMTEQPELHQTPEQRSTIGILYKDGSALQPNSCEAVLSASRFHMDEKSHEARSKKLAVKYAGHAYKTCSGQAWLDACIEHATAQAWAGKWKVARNALQRALKVVDEHDDHPRIRREMLLIFLREADSNLGRGKS